MSSEETKNVVEESKIGSQQVFVENPESTLLEDGIISGVSDVMQESMINTAQKGDSKGDEVDEGDEGEDSDDSGDGFASKILNSHVDSSPDKIVQDGEEGGDEEIKGQNFSELIREDLNRGRRTAVSRDESDGHNSTKVETRNRLTRNQTQPQHEIRASLHQQNENLSRISALIEKGPERITKKLFEDIDDEACKQDQEYGLLNEETFCEVEEISPKDSYSHSEQFNAAVNAFFSEADFQDAFSWRIEDINFSKVVKTIGKVIENCQKEKEIILAIIEQNSLAIFSDPEQPNEYEWYFKDYVEKLLDAYVGQQARLQMDENQSYTVHNRMMDFFLRKTIDEIDFILKEILKLCKYFDSEKRQSIRMSTRAQLIDPIESTKFYDPPKDFEGYPIKAECLEVLKRAIFKLATVFERMNLFTGGAKEQRFDSMVTVEDNVAKEDKRGIVRTRSVTLQVIKPDIKDKIDMQPDENPFIQVDYQESLVDDDIFAQMQDANASGNSSREYGSEPLLKSQRSQLQVLKTSKKDLLRIYSLSKLIYNEIQRLNKRNIEKKAFATEIITEMKEILRDQSQVFNSCSYQLGIPQQILRPADPSRLENGLANPIRKLRSGQLSQYPAKIKEELNALWIDFTKTTSYKSKSNFSEDSHDRLVFILFEIDFKKNNHPYDYTVSLQMMKDKDVAISERMKFSLNHQNNQAQKLTKNYLYLKVPFKAICMNKVGIVVKVYKSMTRCQNQLWILDSYSFIKVYDRWDDYIRCGGMFKEKLKFYSHKYNHDVEQTYTDFFGQQHNNHVLKGKKETTYNAISRITLLSNLIDLQSEQKPIDLSSLTYVIPSLTQSIEEESKTRSIQRKGLDSLNLFSESNLIFNFDERFPTRPYTFDQGIEIKSRIQKYANEIHELFVKIDSIQLPQNSKALRFRAFIETEKSSRNVNDQSTLTERKSYQNPTYGKIYKQLDDIDSPILDKVFMSPIYKIDSSSGQAQCRINESFFIGLPWQIDYISKMNLVIDIDLIGFREKRFFGGLFSQNIEHKDIIEHPNKYEVTPAYRKKINLGKYSQLDGNEFTLDERGQIASYLTQEESLFNMSIVPYSSHDLNNDGLRQVINMFCKWSLNDQGVNFSQIRAGVRQVHDIKTSANHILSMLFQIVMHMDEIDDGYLEIFNSILYVIQKLKSLPNNEGHRIMSLFLQKKEYRMMIINVYSKFLKFIVYISNKLNQFATQDSLPNELSRQAFYQLHLQGFYLLPWLFEIVKAGYSLELQNSNLQSKNQTEHQSVEDEFLYQSNLEPKSLHLINDSSITRARDFDDPQFIVSRFQNLVVSIFKSLGQAVTAKSSYACLDLQRIYFTNMPELFDFVIATFKKDDKSYDKKTNQIKDFLSPLRIEIFKQDPAKAQKFDWLHQVLEEMKRNNQETIFSNEESEQLNLFVIKTVAIGKILKSQAMLSLPKNPITGSDIAKSFCKFFSQNVEDYRLKGERSVPMKGFSSKDVNQNQKIFQHAVLFFLNCFMQFENNFMSYIEGQRDSQNQETTNRLSIQSSESDNVYQSSFQFEEEDIYNMTAKAYIQMDSDQYLMTLIQSLKINEKGLPPQLIIDNSGMTGRNIVVIYHLLESLDRTNMKRLFIRAADESTTIQRTTRKNLRDLLKNLLFVIYKQDLEFNPPFENYGEQYQFTVIANFTTQLCYVLLKRQKEQQLVEDNNYVQEFRPIFSKLWLIMLLNFLNTQKRNTKQLNQAQSQEDYFKQSGKQFQTMLYFMKEAKRYDSQMILMPSKQEILIFTNHILVGLSQIIEKEASQNTCNTLDHVLELLLIYDEVQNCRVLNQDSSEPVAEKNEPFNILQLISHISEIYYANCIQIQGEIQLQYPYDKLNNHNTFQAKLLEALNKIACVEKRQQRDSQIENNCYLCQNMRGMTSFNNLSIEQFRTFDLKNLQNLRPRCSRFIKLMKEVKELGKRQFLFEASSKKHMQNYDSLYHTYAHYMLVREKVKYMIFSYIEQPKTLFSEYKQALLQLQAGLIPMPSDNENQEQHFETELAFCNVQQIMKEHDIFEAGLFQFKEKQREHNKKDLMRSVPETTRELIKAGFMLEAFNLNKKNFYLALQDIYKGQDPQTANYLKHMLYYDQMFFNQESLAKLSAKQRVVAQNLNKQDEQKPMQMILRDQMRIAQGIEQFEDQNTCEYFLIKFFGNIFAQELVDSPYGFILRGKKLQQKSELSEELKKNYGVNIDDNCFLNLASFNERIIDRRTNCAPTKSQEQPLIVIIKLLPLTQDIQQSYSKGEIYQHPRVSHERQDSMIYEQEEECKEETKDSSHSNQKLLQEKELTPKDKIISEAHKDFSNQNYKKNFYTNHFEHNEKFQTDCHNKINKKVDSFGVESLTKDQCNEFFKKLLNMQGNVSSKGNLDPKEFWKKVMRYEHEDQKEQEQSTTARKDCVKRAAQDHWDKLKNYEDSIITVYEVDETFPTIFFMQEIKDEVFDVKINCIQVATKEVKEFDFELREALQKFNLLMCQEHEEQAQQSIPAKPVTDLFKELEKQLNFTVGDGAKTYMGFHFAEDGYQDLNVSNPNYHMLLELFHTLESFLGTLKLCLKTLEQHRSFVSAQMGEIHVNLCFTLFWKKWDEFREYQNANRDRREIDLLMAQARDDLESDSDEDYEI